jgi:hypothetical protein
MWLKIAKQGRLQKVINKTAENKMQYNTIYKRRNIKK